jgi:hypothetical protein
VKPLSAASSIEEIAATVSDALSEAAITAVLSGGGAAHHDFRRALASGSAA